MLEPNANAPPPEKRRFLQRWLGWRGILAVLLIFVLLSPVLYRGYRLSKIPVSQEPFDVEAFTVEIPDEDNAAVPLAQATSAVVNVASTDFDNYFRESEDGWDSHDATVEKYLRANQPALELWRDAALRTEFQPDLIETDIEENYYRNLRDLNRFAVIQSQKLAALDQPQLAIDWIEAMLRHGYLFRKKSPDFHLYLSTAFVAMGADAAQNLSMHPDLGRVDILELIARMKTARDLAPPRSENVKAGYLYSRRHYVGSSAKKFIELYRERKLPPPMESRFIWWMHAEPEYTGSLLPHITRNHLLFVDEPRRKRPQFIGGDLFDDTSMSSALTGVLPAERLHQLLLESRILQAEQMQLIAGLLSADDRCETTFRCHLVVLAAQAFFRDHGEFPATIAELAPDYLDDVPDDLYAPVPAPLLYRREGEDAVVYSRFEDGVDDGGREFLEDESHGSKLPDFGFRIRKPFLRPLKAPKPVMP